MATSAIIYDAYTSIIKKKKKKFGGGRIFSASGSKTIVSSSMPTSVVIYDAYTCMIKKIYIYIYASEILALIGVELETLVFDPDAQTTRPPPFAVA